MLKYVSPPNVFLLIEFDVTFVLFMSVFCGLVTVGKQNKSNSGSVSKNNRYFWVMELIMSCLLSVPGSGWMVGNLHWLMCEWLV